MSRYGPRIAALERRAERERAAVGRDGSAPDPEAATASLREGAGRAVWLYVEGRTGGRTTPFSPAELRALERAMNAWLECYAARHGVEIDAAFTVREAADLLLRTRNVHDVGQLLTGVPARE